MRWAIVLNAWWGSFRIGELLSKNRHTYCPKNSLLASDVTFNENSVSFWLRSPKIERQKTGDVVEVWNIPSRADLDPVLVLKAFSEKREEKFGKAMSTPMFIHEDGAIYTKLEFNSDLAYLLSKYPELNTTREKDEKLIH